MSAILAGSSERTNGRRDATSRLRLVGPGAISLDWGATTEVVSWPDVISAHSVRNHTEIVTRDRTLKVHCPLKTIVVALASLGLVQVRRDVAVNGGRVRRLIGAGRHRLTLVLDGGACVQVGRQFQHAVRARFGPKAPSLGASSPS